MATFTKHVGQGPHGTRLVVVFREIPGAEDHCLCVESDSLSEMYHDQFMREVTSKEAQDTVDLFKILERRHFGDGQQMLNGLHNGGKLRKLKVSEVTMIPMSNRPVALSIINEQINTGTIASEDSDSAEVEADVPAADGAGVSVDTSAGLVQTVKVTPVEVGTGTDDAKSIAESKLLQARLMEEDAKKMREDAYALDPALKKGGRPKKVKE